jgi:hypothetical protein
MPDVPLEKPRGAMLGGARLNELGKWFHRIIGAGQ